MLQTALLCLALNIHYEARGEPIEGQFAVAHVTINRSKENKTSICHEVFKKGQFSWTKKRYSIPKDDTWKRSKKVAEMALKNKDSTNGATYFFNPSKCRTPHSIIKNRIKTKIIGNHVFYANKNSQLPRR